MLWTEALEIVVAKTGVERYRTLCADDSPHPAKVATYRSLMLRKASELAGPPPAPRPPLPATLDAMKLVKACPHRTRDAGCGCSGHRCAIGKGRGGLVAHRDCLACVGLPVAVSPTRPAPSGG